MTRISPGLRLLPLLVVVALATLTTSVVAMGEASAAMLPAHADELASSKDAPADGGSDQQPPAEEPEPPAAESEGSGSIVFALVLAVIGGGTVLLIWRTSRKLDDP